MFWTGLDWTEVHQKKKEKQKEEKNPFLKGQLNFNFQLGCELIIMLDGCFCVRLIVEKYKQKMELHQRKEGYERLKESERKLKSKFSVTLTVKH